MMQTQDSFDDPRTSFKYPKWALIPTVLLALFIGVALVIPQFLDQDRYKDQIVQKISDATGYTINWNGDVSLSLLPLPHATIYKASVSNGSQKILDVQEASISVALAPLLKKRVEIKSITLIKPDITLLVNAAGQQTWLTGKLDKTKSESAEGSDTSSKEKQFGQISIESFHVENGSLLYRDDSAKTEQVISNLNANLSAESLSGPFDMDADLVYQGHDVKMTADIGELKEAQPAHVDVNISLPKNDVEGGFKGEVTLSDKSAKGKISLSVNSLQETLRAFGQETNLPKEIQGKLKFDGNVDYTAAALNLAQATLELGDLNYKGNVGVTNLPENPQIRLDLVSSSPIDNPSSLPIKILSDIKIDGGGSYSANRLTLVPTTIIFDGQTVNLQGNYTSGTKGGRPLIDLMLSANELDIDDLQQQLGKPGKSSAKKISQSNEAKNKPALKGVMLPFDGNIRSNIQKLSFSGKKYSDIKIDITNTGPNLKINQFSINAVAATNISVTGQVANLPELSGLNLNILAKSSDIESLLKAYNVSPPNIGHTIGSGMLNGRFTGSLDNLGFDATANALEFAIKGVGQVQSPLAQPVIKTLNLNVKHPSLHSAVRIFSPGYKAVGSLNGPLDIGTNIELKDQQYNLADIRGNLGSTTVGGNIQLKLGDAKPDISGNLNFGKLVFESVAPESGSSSSSSSSGNGSAQTESGGSRWSREAIDTAWMNKINADLSVKVATLQSGLWLLNNANLAFKLNDGSLNVRDLSAGLFGGSVALNGSMNSASGGKGPLSMNWTAKAKNLDSKNLLSAMRNKQSDTLTGTIQSFDADIKAQGISPAALVANLSGNGTSRANNIIIKGVDAAKLAQTASGSYKPLERAGSLFASFQDGQTSFTDFDMSFVIANGIVDFTKLNFDGPQATLVSTGNVNLPRWTINLKNKMTVKNTDVPPFEFTVAGPLDNPAQTGSSVIESYLQQRAVQKIQEKYGDKINEKLNKLGLPGLLGGAAAPSVQAPKTQTPVTQEVAPSVEPVTDKTVTPEADTSSATPVTGDEKPVEKTKEQKKQEQIEQGVKALQGLFGQ